MKKEFESRFYTVKELAKVMNLHYQTIYSHVCPGSKKAFPIRHKMILGRIRFDKRDVEQYIKNF